MTIDNNKYVNTYIETLISFIHENVTNALQFKTQLKLTNDLIQEKSEVISTLTNEKEELQKKLISEKEPLLQQIAQKDNHIAQIESTLRGYDGEKNTLKQEIKNISDRKYVLEQERNKIDSIITEKETIINNIIREKDGVIATINAEKARLEEELRKCQGNLGQKNTDSRMIENAKRWEAEYNAMKTKISHMDTFSKQIVDMKREIVARDEKIKQLSSNVPDTSVLNAKIAELTAKIQELTSENSKLNIKKEKNKTKTVKKLPIEDDF